MPVLARFYGITVKMYFQQSEHNPPHIHACYGEYAVEIAIISREVLEGEFPPRALILVREWIEINETELLNIWKTQKFKSVSPLN